MSDLLNQASLVYIPSGYKEDTAYSVIPTDGSGDLTFTRASDGTRVNSQGLVERVPWNLLQQSESFSTSPWANTNVTLTSGQIDPNGGTTAFRAQFSGVSYLLQNLTALNGTNSIYAKAYGSTAKIRLCDPNGSFSTQYNLTTEWQRITTSGNALAGFSIDSYIDGGWTSQDIVMAFAQTNIGSTAKPYFPTTDRLNVPRLDYSGGCPSLLLEPQRTNLATYSEDATQWDIGSNVGTITVTANQAISPDGTQNADKIEFPAVGSGSQYAVLFFPFTASATTYTGSMWLKGNSGGEVVWLNFTKDGVNYTQQLCTLTTSWQRFNLTSTLTSGADHFQVGVDTRDSAESAKPAQTIYVWGRQLEAGSYATSYIPTTSASVTRVADAASKTGISSLIGQTEGTMFAEFNMMSNANSGSYQTIVNIATDANNSIDILKNNTTSELYVFAINGGVIQVNSVGISGTNILGRHKIALAYKLNDYVCYLDGVQVFADTSATVPACSNLYVGAYLGASNILAGAISQAALFKTRLTNAELAALTTL